MTSPVPNIEAILREVARHVYKSLLDLKGAFDQVRIVPRDVEKTAMTTPDGNIESLVLQIGDVNAPPTYQALMNHIFGPYIGVFMDVYLDDIVVYSDSIEDHIKHCKIVFDVLAEQVLYLSERKIQLLPRELNILGRVITDQGIRMDAGKVTSVVDWKTPTTKDHLASFLGSVGFLADDITRVRIPMGVLHTLAAPTTQWEWTETADRAFRQVK